MTNKHFNYQLPGWVLPNFTIFFSSACIMILEIVAGKLIARHVGMSLYTWTSIIGVIMAGMAVGNHFGGRLADRYRAAPTLSALFFSAALGCAIILPLNGLSGKYVPFLAAPWSLRIFIHVALVFFLPATLLGTMNPVVTKMALDLKRAQGRTLGGVFAWGVIGSLFGTFIAGFYLVMVMRITTIVIASALGLGLLGGLYCIIACGGRISRHSGSPRLAGAPRPKISFRIWSPAAITVFISNAAFMIFELAILRVASREFGGSLYTGTTVIGIVLAGICLGNYCGGRLADRWDARKLVALVFCASALAVALSPPMHSLVSAWRYYVWYLASLSWPVQLIIHVLWVGFIPCFFIGMVSPVVTRRLLQQGNAPGASVGTIYAWGSMGAIAGTFLAGYLLIQALGSIPVVMSVSVLLALTALFYAPSRAWTMVIGGLGGVILCLFCLSLPELVPVNIGLGYRSPDNPRVVYEDESQYSHITVIEDQNEPAVREIYLDCLVHSRIDMRDHTHLLYEYEWVYSGILNTDKPVPETVRAFVIGGGGYAYPHYLEIVRPGSDITVAEIDPAVTEAAHAALGLPRDSNIRIYDLDARNVVTDMVRKLSRGGDFQRFDYIFGDSINDYTVPFHLTTLEFKQAIHDLLTDDGIYLFNMIDMYDSGAFLSAIVKTCRNVFPQVAVYNSGRLSFSRDTFVVVCSRRNEPVEDVTALLRGQYGFAGERLPSEDLDALIERNNAPVLTDDYAPVENLLAPVMRAGRATLGETHILFATRYISQNKLDRALYHARAAVEAHPQWSTAHEMLATVLAMKGDTEGVIESLTAAIPGNPNPAKAWENLATTLMNAGRKDEAINAWLECVKANPVNVNALYNLGVLYGERNQLGPAVKAWQHALKIDPKHADSLYNLAVAKVMLGDIAEARKLVETMRSFGHPVDANMLETLQMQP